MKTLEAAMATGCPIRRISQSAEKRHSPMIPRLAIKASSTGHRLGRPTQKGASIRLCMSRVVITPGPIMSGVPSGTTPNISGNFMASSALSRIMSCSDMQSSTIPPAIWRSATSTPMALRRMWPKSVKMSPRLSAVTRA